MLGGDFKIDYSKYDDYFGDTEEYKIIEEQFNNITSTSIENTCKKELEKQIQKDIKEIGFNANNIYLDINLETGEINNISLTIDTSQKEIGTNSILIDKIEIGKSKKADTLPKQDIEKIKNILKEKYNIDSEKITLRKE